MSSGAGGDAAAAGSERQYAAAKTSVWWDIENCQVPRGSDAHVIAQNISSALASVGYNGPLTISAYGDTNKIPTAVQQALSSTGIALNHVPAGVKDASDKKILVDMLFWAVDNPPPANYLLISGDRDFSNCLHQLSMRRYNILLAHAPNVSQALVAAARKVWLWTSLLSGGPPLPTSDSSCPANSCNGSSNMRNENSSSTANADERDKVKQAWKNRTTSLPPASKEVNGGQLTKQMSMPVVSTSEVQKITQSSYVSVSSTPYSFSQMPSGESDLSRKPEGKQLFNKAPHEFFGASKPKTSVESSFNQTPVSSGNYSISSSRPTQYSQPSRPNCNPPSQPGFSPNPHNHSSYVSPAWPNANALDFTRLNISERPCVPYQNNSLPHQNSGPHGYIQNFPPVHHDMTHNRPQLNPLNGNLPSNNSSCGGASGGQMSSGMVQGFLGNIQSALYELKVNKMTPTEANIGDCIRYGMGIQNFNVRMALNCAIEHNVVVMHKLGANLPFYIGKNDKLWKCVNPLDCNARHPEATWDAVRSFLSSTHGQSAISATECRYQAAIMLKKVCLQHVALGDVLQVLNMIVQIRKWIIPSFPAWQPLTFTLKVEPDVNAGAHK